MAAVLDLASPRPLTPDETSSLTSSLRPHLRLHNTSCPLTAEADATDLLTYACDLVDDGEPIGNVLEELSLMEMEICDDEVLEKFLGVLGEFIAGLIQGPKKEENWRKNNYLYPHRSGQHENNYWYAQPQRNANNAIVNSDGGVGQIGGGGGSSVDSGGSRGEMIENQAQGQSTDSSEDTRAQDMSSREASPERDYDYLISHLDMAGMMALSCGAGPYVGNGEQRKPKKDRGVNDHSTANREEEKCGKKAGGGDTDQDGHEEKEQQEEEEEEGEEETSEHINWREDLNVGAQIDKSDVSDKDKSKDRARDVSPNESKPKEDWRVNNYLIAGLEEKKRKEEMRATRNSSPACGAGGAQDLEYSTQNDGPDDSDKDKAKDRAQDVSPEDSNPKEDWRANNYLIASLELEETRTLSCRGELAPDNVEREPKKDQRASNHSTDYGGHEEGGKWEEKPREEGRKPKKDWRANNYLIARLEEEKYLRKSSEDEKYLRNTSSEGAHADGHEDGREHGRQRDLGPKHPNWRDAEARSGREDPHSFEKALLGGRNHVAVDLSSKTFADKTAQELQSVFGGRERKSLRDRMSMYNGNGEIRKDATRKEEERDNGLGRRGGEEKCLWKSGDDTICVREPEGDEIRTKYKRVEEESPGSQNERNEAKISDPHSFEKALLGSKSHVAVDLSSKSSADRGAQELQDLFGGLDRKSLRDRMSMYDEKGEIRKEEVWKEAEEEKCLWKSGDNADYDGGKEREEIRVNHKRMEEERPRYQNWRDEAAGDEDDPHSFENALLGSQSHVAVDLSSKKAADKNVQELQSIFGGGERKSLRDRMSMYDENGEIRKDTIRKEAEGEKYRRCATDPGHGRREPGGDGCCGHQQAADDCFVDFDEPEREYSNWRDGAGGGQDNPHSFENALLASMGHVAVDLSSRTAVDKKNKELQDLFGGTARRSLQDRMGMYNENGAIKKDPARKQRARLDDPNAEVRRQELRVVMNDRSLSKSERAARMDEVRAKYGAAGSEVAAQHASKLSALAPPGHTPVSLLSSVSSQFSVDDSVSNEPAPRVGEVDLSSKAAVHKKNRELQRLFGVDKVNDSVSNEPAPRVGEVDLSSNAAVHKKNRELQILFGADKADDSVSNEPAPRVGGVDLSSTAAVHKKNRELQSLFRPVKAGDSVSNEPAPTVGGVDLSSKAAVHKKNRELQSLFGADKRKSLKDRMAMYNEQGKIIKQSSGSEEEEVGEEPKEKKTDQLRRDELMVVMRDRSLGKEERSRKMEEVRQKYLASATADVPFTRRDSNHSIASSGSDDEPAAPPLGGVDLSAKKAADKVKREMEILFEGEDGMKEVVKGSFSRYTRQLVHNKVEMRKPMTFLNRTKSHGRQESGKTLRKNSSGSDSASARQPFALKDQRRAELQQVMRDMSLTKGERQRKMEGIRKKYDAIARKRDEQEVMSENRNRHNDSLPSSQSSSTGAP